MGIKRRCRFCLWFSTVHVWLRDGLSSIQMNGCHWASPSIWSRGWPHVWLSSNDCDTFQFKEFILISFFQKILSCLQTSLLDQTVINQSIWYWFYRTLDFVHLLKSRFHIKSVIEWNSWNWYLHALLRNIDTDYCQSLITCLPVIMKVMTFFWIKILIGFMILFFEFHNVEMLLFTWMTSQKSKMCSR